MMMRSTPRLVLTLSCFAVIFTLFAAARTVSAQCDKVTDEQIVADIYAKIKADSRLAAQISHVNVVSIYAAVKFQGWADSKRDYDKIVGFAINADCVKLVNVNLFLEAPPATGDLMRSAGGCAAGTKACGDICIPEGDVCSLTKYLGSVPDFLRLKEDRNGFLALAGSCY